MICTTPRSGSWLLCGLLASTGVAGLPHEWFVEPVEERNLAAWNVASFGEYVEHARRAATTPNGRAAVKVMWATHAQLLDRLHGLNAEVLLSDRAVFERVFPHARYVWLVRDDVDAQAASWATALRTGVWADWGSDARTPPQVPASLGAIAAEIREHNAAWRAWFDANSIEPHVTSYEELVEDPEGAAASVLRFLGVASGRPRVLTAPTPPIG